MYEQGVCRHGKYVCMIISTHVDSRRCRSSWALHTGKLLNFGPFKSQKCGTEAAMLSTKDSLDEQSNPISGTYEKRRNFSMLVVKNMFKSAVHEI